MYHFDMRRSFKIMYIKNLGRDVGLKVPDRNGLYNAVPSCQEKPKRLEFLMKCKGD